MVKLLQRVLDGELAVSGQGDLYRRCSVSDLRKVRLLVFLVLVALTHIPTTVILIMLLLITCFLLCVYVYDM